MPFKPLSSSNSNESNIGQTNDMLREIFDRETVQIFKDDTGTRRVLLGKGMDGFYGLKVSQPNVDVYSAATDELVFNSDNNVFKIVDSGTLALDFSGYVAPSPGAGAFAEATATLGTYTHNLGFAPAFIAFLVVGSDYLMLPYISNGVGNTSAKAYWFTINANVTTTEFSVDVAHLAYGGSGFGFAGGSVKFFLLQETAN